MSLCSPRVQRASVDALDIPFLVDNQGGGSIPAVIHTPSSTPLSVSYSYDIPMSNISQVPRSLPVRSVVDDTTRSTTTIPMRLPLTQGDVLILDVVHEDVEVLDVCHAAGCGLTSSAIKKCQHCWGFRTITN
jgi:hypothetical protein